MVKICQRSGRVGNQNARIEHHMGKEAEKPENKEIRKDRIIKLCIRNSLVLTNIKFRQKYRQTNKKSIIN